MLPTPSSDFSRARSKALINEMQHLLNPEEAQMISFNQIKQIIKPENETYMGMQAIPVSKIVGSEGRYKDFDNQFFPKNSFMKERWERVDSAIINDIVLPPIRVYELAGLYFVRDGNHRVSVAKSKGVEFIDAEVVSLQTEVRLSPVHTLTGITKQIVNYEKRNFYFETSYGDITDYWNLDLSIPGQYDIIYQHILTHKYFINMGKKEEISMEQAIKSWHTTVFLPAIAIIEKYNIIKYIKNRTTGDLYIYLVDSLYQINEKFGAEIQLETFVADIKQDYKWSLMKKIRNFKNKCLLRIKKTSK
ncbi:MAG: transcriptional regulator [Treponema sp.]|nr:transcriptional regulator [Treponema sp.]MDE6245785.1 transcriptional regulator [Treponemataceae bacterium]MBD5410765.1 transcriptional regulator [Treponema sp.]MBD5412124.1 transcriptional regulator [Treponema sp.]MBD5413610.1 transcriptional regulator [Treponema sp.]